MEGKRVLTIGEILLRLSTPKGDLLQDTTNFNANYGGSEANVAIALSNMGIDSSFFTVLPNNEFKDTVISILHSNNVNTSKCLTAEGRQGIYFLETGASIRSSKVLYDRKYSAFSMFDYSSVDLEKIVSEYSWVHLSGITPALSLSCRYLISETLEICYKRGIPVSFDGNFRKKLWSMEEARTTIDKYLSKIRVLIGLEPFHLFDKNGINLKENLEKVHSFEQAKIIFEAINEQYPNIECIFDTIRDSSESSDKGALKAYLNYKGKSYESETVKFEVIDRVGSGDASTAGLLYGLMNNMDPEETLKYALYSGALAHSVKGDFSRFSSDRILELCHNNGNRDVCR